MEHQGLMRSSFQNSTPQRGLLDHNNSTMTDVNHCTLTSSATGPATSGTSRNGTDKRHVYFPEESNGTNWRASNATNHESSLSKDAATRLGTRGGNDDMALGSEWSEGEGNGTSSLAPPRSTPPRAYHVGIYGWRKRCLYMLILGLVAVVIVNLALTLWLLKVMEFSSEGMGKLRVVAGGLQLNGQAMVLDALVASTIRSRRGQPITIDSSVNFSVNARDMQGRMVSRLFLGSEGLDFLAQGFRITDSNDKTLFSATANEVVVGAESLRVTGVGGAVFDGSIQTPLVRADSGYDLRLESPTRSLDIKAPLGVAIESRAGDISASCLTDLKLQSVAGTIRLDSANVFIPGLRTVNLGPGSSPLSSSRGTSDSIPRTSRAQEIYQLCACSNGRLFLAPPAGICAADSDVCR